MKPDKEMNAMTSQPRLLPTLSLSLLLAAGSLSTTANAHRSWILPAATVHSSEEPWVTFDAAISNDIFHIDYRPMRLDDVKALAPDGSHIELQNPHTGKYRSTFDLNLTQRGTYKIYTASHGLTARWETEDGERRSWPPRGSSPDPAGFQENVPQQAKNLQITESSRRQETFVTAGVPDEAVFEPQNQGLELVPITHPNDLFAGETAQFSFLIDGKPAAGVEVTVIAGGVRYRDSQDEILVKSDKQGVVEVTWPQPGMYWLEASYQDEAASPPAQQRRGSYIATFEVLPF